MASMIDGLLGQMRSPNVSQGLLALGGQMLQAGGQGIAPGAALGQGIQAYQQAYRNSQEQEKQARIETIRQKAMEQITDEDLRLLAQLDPSGQTVAQVLAARMKPASGGGPSVVAPGGALVGSNGEVLFQNPARAASDTPYYTPVPTAQGVYTFNNRTGKMELAPGVGGSPILTPPTDPNLKKAMESAGAAGDVEGKARAEAQIALPQTIANAEKAVNTLTQLVSSPGFPTLYGKSGAFGLASRIPASQAADARALLNQVQGEAFLTAYESLRGSGAITDTEGKAATLAMSRLFDTNQSDAAAFAAAQELQQIVSGALVRAKAKAGASQQAPQPDFAAAARAEMERRRGGAR